MTVLTVGPEQSLNAAINKLRPGDVLKVEPGIYHEVIDVALMGEPNNRIVIEAADPNNKPIIDGKAPHNLSDAPGGDINYGLPQARWVKRNMNPGSKTFGATAATKALVNLNHHSGNFILRNLIIRNSLGRAINFEAASTKISRNVTFDGLVLDWARLQMVSIKNVGNVQWLNCEIAHAASFFQTAGRAHRGPKGDLQTHNAALSMGGVDGVLIRNMILHDCWGEGIIFSANRVMSSNITVQNFTGWDCYKSPLYIHAAQHVEINNALVYRSADNIKARGGGVDDPQMKTNGVSIQSSEGNKDWGISTHHVTVSRVTCHHAEFGLRIGGSPNTEPIHHIDLIDNVIANCDGNALTLKGNKPQHVTIRGNIFYHDNAGKELVEAYPGRYDNTTTIAANKWSKKPPAFCTGPNDQYGNINLPIQSAPLPAGTLVDGDVQPPDPPDPPVFEKPDPPVLNSIQLEDDTVIVSWQAVEGAVGYRLQQRWDGNPHGWQLIETDITDIEMIYTDMPLGLYEYRVRVNDGMSWSEWSNVESVEIKDKPEPPEPPPPSEPAEVEIEIEVGPSVVWEMILTEDSVTAIRRE